MTHVDRRKRQSRIIKAVKSGESVYDVADREGVSLLYATKMCKVAGLTTKNVGTGTSTLLKILFLLINGERQVDIAKRFGVTRQWVHLVSKMGKDAGFKIRLVLPVGIREGEA